MIRDLVRPHVLRMICGEPYRPEMCGVAMLPTTGVLMKHQKFWFGWKCPKCRREMHLAISVHNPRCLKCSNG